MKLGKAFELFVKNLLISVGFSEVKSDGLYVFDGAAGQMLQGLGEAHNADALLEPPVQTPFYSRSRLLIECKDYRTKIGLNTVRSTLGLKEDINNFELAHRIGQRMALAITNTGQILFLYHEQGEEIKFADDYMLHWISPGRPWRLSSGNQSYLFQLPDDIMRRWLENASDELNMKKEAITCKATFLSNMVVYYTEAGRPVIRMISINKYELEEARMALER